MTTDLTTQARLNVLERLKAAHERFLLRKMDLMVAGAFTEAARAHAYAEWIRRAHDAERDDPGTGGPDA